MEKLLSLCRHPVPLVPVLNRVTLVSQRFSHSTEQQSGIVRKARKYLLNRFAQFVKGYEKFLEKNFPSAANVYRVFLFGTRDFYKDMRQYLSLARSVRSKGKGVKFLNRKELEIYYRMPGEMIRVAPVLLMSTLPFANYVVFPLAYMYPKTLLSSHFWTLQQKTEFAIIDLRKRLFNNRPVFRCLQERLRSIKGQELFQDWARILSLLGSGVHPEVEEVIKCTPLFEGEPYHISTIYNNHVNGLLRMHGMHMGFSRRRRLEDRALIIHEMDLAMAREGISGMALDELKWACFLRGLNPINMKTEDMVAWLTKWTKISIKLESKSLSLLLHCPILLAYNHPTNWVLIH
ncbi:LETM1 domain-containing protein 1 [Ischnura elegans]|uniref:LETM1 domain-containing protein 1 n=1 Tax=Ischnura elegans TaxID=197161 RepID=UPI001ED873F2|nr:LETM1 domain-containing protein 1 [Ischnura elegans]XP_046389818.1 LETM1 domain-containing protein 1 [Ischnura elegans]